MPIEDDIATVIERLDAWVAGYKFAARTMAPADATNIPKIINDAREALGSARYHIAMMSRQIRDYQNAPATHTGKTSPPPSPTRPLDAEPPATP